MVYIKHSVRLDAIGCQNAKEKVIDGCKYEIVCCQHCKINICRYQCKSAHDNWCPNKGFIINDEVIDSNSIAFLD